MNYTSPSSEERTNKLSKQLETNHGIRTTVVQADLGSENGPAHIVEIARNHFAHPKTGKFQIDIIINNAGVSVNRRIQDCDTEDFAFQYNVNVRGPLLLMKAAMPYLPHDRSGRIVNLSSVSAPLGFIAQSVYGGTKAALEAMTRTWARELAERATVNAVNPGPVATDMYHGTTDEFAANMKPFIQHTPLMATREGVDPPEVVEEAKTTGGRNAHDWEIAGVIGMLCMPESGWSTGSVVCANGGMTFSV
jgi:NAD(P)-dependent dehydrogenase (short-subunit alcohol dehydrogenase family)